MLERAADCRERERNHITHDRDIAVLDALSGSAEGIGLIERARSKGHILILVLGAGLAFFGVVEIRFRRGINKQGAIALVLFKSDRTHDCITITSEGSTAGTAER